MAHQSTTSTDERCWRPAASCEASPSSSNYLHRDRSSSFLHRRPPLMIAFVEVLPPAGHSKGIQLVARLPEPPATRFSGFMVRCEHESGLATTLAWYGEVTNQRPGVPLGIVYSRNLSLAMLAEFEHPIRPVLSTDELIAGAPPIAAVEHLREVSVEGVILEEFVSEFGESILTEAPILNALIARGVVGGKLESTARELECSQETIRLHLARFRIRPGRVTRPVDSSAPSCLRPRWVSCSISACPCGGWRHKCGPC